MPDIVHLLVEEGPDKGREITVPSEGGRLGRSPKNDFVLTDPKLSRYHCRFFFKPDIGLCVADLGSSNQTVVNDSPTQETRLSTGDRITVGDTVLKVLIGGPESVKGAAGTGGSGVDLGFQRPARTHGTVPVFGVKRLLVVAGVVIVLAAGIWLLKRPPARPAPAPSDEGPVAVPSLEIRYEKVQADTDGIFRYHLVLTVERDLTIQVDDTSKTHLREQGQVREELIGDLTTFVRESGFFSLADEYTGLQPDVLDEWDLSITVGLENHRVFVRNRVEPEVFKTVRERIEKFGQVELGLWAVQFSPEKLLEMASDAYLLGKKLFDEREIQPGNLAAAIRSFGEADFYLKTIDPKPDFYADSLVATAECREILEEKYKQQNYVAERAIQMRQFDEAAGALRVLCRMIPDRSDPRHHEARTKLLEVERRLELEK